MTTLDSLADWLRYLEGLHPKAIDLGLDRVAAVADTLALRPASAATITVAGTNGKGSVVAVTATGLAAAGHSVGVYTSPHLMQFNERIVINGAQVRDDDLIQAFTAIEQARGPISLSYFEYTTLAALWLFKRAGVDWQVLEVGLGGRLDAVNIIDPDIAVITSIGLDHTEWLGPTRETIAPEKAGIARQGVPVVVIERDPPASLQRTLDELGADSLWIGREWDVQSGQVRFANNQLSPVPTVDGLLTDNVGGALQALVLAGVVINPDVLLQVAAILLPGRRHRRSWQQYEVVFDVAHNLEAVSELMAFIGDQGEQKRTVAIFATMADKPIRGMIDVSKPYIDQWYLPALPESARAALPDDIAPLLPEENVVCFKDFDAAWAAAERNLQLGERLLVFGSFITVGAGLSRVG